MIIKDVISDIESIAPLSLQESWDNSGFQIGNPNNIVKGVLTTFEVNEAVVDEAISLNCNLIISHHPLFFAPFKKILPSVPHYNIIRKAIIHDITIYSAHTNLDTAQGGVNTALANKLCLKNTRSFSDSDEISMGIIGQLEVPMETMQFVQHVKQLFNVRELRYSKTEQKSVQTIAVCGGSGASFLNRVLELGADAYVTGDFKYHEFAAAENKVLVVDIGHYESEMHTKDIFYDIVNKKNANFAVHISNVNTNSVNHL